MNGAEAVWIVCRFLQDVALAFLWGSCAYLTAAVPGMLAMQIAGQMRTALVTAIAVLSLATIASLPAQTGVIGDGWPDAVRGDMLWSVLTLTGNGKAWFIQAFGCVTLVLTASAVRPLRPALLAVCSGLTFASLALTGHAAIQGGTVGYLHRINDVLHVLAGGAWLGALVPFLLIMRKTEVAATHAEAVIAMRRFSSLGHAAVALVLLSGLLNLWLVLGRLPLDWRSPYQSKLLLKIAAVTAATTLAVVNRYVLVPRLRRRPNAASALKRTTLCEIGLGVTAIALVAALGTEDPA